MRGLFSFLNLSFLPKSPDFALLVLRAGLGLGMARHGWEKWVQWDQWVGKFPDPLKITPKWSLTGTVFAELVCAVLLVAGFCTRLAAVVLVFTMCVAFFMVHQGDLKAGEAAALYGLGFAAIVFAGPGKFAFDSTGGGSAGPPGH